MWFGLHKWNMPALRKYNTSMLETGNVTLRIWAGDEERPELPVSADPMGSFFQYTFAINGSTQGMFPADFWIRRRIPSLLTGYSFRAESFATFPGAGRRNREEFEEDYFEDQESFFILTNYDAKGAKWEITMKSVCNETYYGRSCDTVCIPNPERSFCDKFGNLACFSNWTGEGCDEDVNECEDSFICWNEASCTNLEGSYRCDCLPGTTGVNCEIDIDDCGNHSCKNGADCMDKLNNYTCYCQLGWQGRFCDVDKDECAKSHTLCDMGKCENTVGSFKCVCNAGYTGEKCDQDIDECITNPCDEHHNCKNAIGSYQCNCFSGYEGARCDQDIDECVESNPCKHGGECKNFRGGFDCLCPSQYNGTLCENDVDECKIKGFCQNNGACINLVGSFECLCREEYTGLRCEFRLVNCTARPCQNNGTCVSFNSSVGFSELLIRQYCKCSRAFEGDYCEKDTNECVKYKPCQHFSTCRNEWGSYRCDCHPAVTGRNCEIFKPCGEFPCLNGGTCTAKHRHFRCVCSEGFDGPQCQLQLTDKCKHGETERGCEDHDWQIRTWTEMNMVLVGTAICFLAVIFMAFTFVVLGVVHL